MDVPQLPGPLLRRVRHLAGRTQREFAAQAGVPQSVISQYESGGREPSLRTLRRLVRAAGYDLVLRLEVPVGDGPAMHGPVGARLREHAALVLERTSEFGLVNIRVIGRVARSTERDVDPLELLAEPGPGFTPMSTSVAGLVGLLVGAQCLIYLPGELDEEELAEELTHAVALAAAD